MAELSDEMKTFIVTAHAQFRRPAEIIAMMWEEFEVRVERDQVVRYNPTRACYQGAAEYRELFEQARKAYIEDVSSEPIANQGFRLKELRDLYAKAKKAGNFVLAAQLLEQVAKEVGGALTNERVHRSDGRPMQPGMMSAEERRVALLDLLTSALAGRGKVVHEGVTTEQ